MHPILTIAVRAARSAGDIITRGLERLDKVEVAAKGHNNYVTNIDCRAEQEIISIISKAYPDHGFLAEESGETSGKECTWIIDPLDGTVNFIHGFPHFAVSIALKQQNNIEHAVIYDPIRQELFTASRGQGAYLNNHRLRVSRRKSIDGALLGTGFPFRQQLDLQEYLSLIQEFYPAVSGFRRCGSAVLDLAYVAAGRLDGHWEVGLNPWDIAAGSLLVREAGGLVGDLSGGEDFLASGDIIAATPKVFTNMLKIIQNFYTNNEYNQ